ncbi:MAG: hypothetical protein KDB27_28965 [Planctomycetales bacterium]|nr:hypothetical protein [Planctomycetales bacterium]
MRSGNRIPNNPVTGLLRLWHRHRVIHDDDVVIQFEVDIGFPCTLFEEHPHLLIIRRLEDRAPDLSEKAAENELLLLGTCSLGDEWWEWKYWCNDSTLDAIEPILEESTDECFLTEDDNGEFFRACLLPSNFRGPAEDAAQRCVQFSNSTETIYHSLRFDSEKSARLFEANVAHLGFVCCNFEPTEIGVRAIFQREARLDAVAQYHDVAMLYDIIERSPDGCCYERCDRTSW